MLEELKAIKLIDDHCHAFTDSGPLDAGGLAEMLALASSGMEFAATAAGVRRHNENTVFYRWVLRELAGFLGCDPEPTTVMAARNEEARDYAAYTRRLLENIGLEAILVDTGYPQPPVDMNVFRSWVPCRVESIFRLEALIKGLLASDLPWNGFRRAYEEAIAAAVKKEEHVALKSIIAYRTGLEVQPSTEAEARRAYESRRRQAEVDLKPLRDYLLCRALSLSIELGVPLQLHTGFGDLDIAFNKRQPALLFDLLEEDRFRAAKIILLHCYPFVDDAAYMTAILPNVYCDLSLTLPYTHSQAAYWLARALTVAPASKILYGSDGFNLPETHWLAARLARRALSQVLEEMINGGYLGRGDALSMAHMILAGNARQVYGLDAV